MNATLRTPPGGWQRAAEVQHPGGSKLPDISPNAAPRIGLVLSSGGARGLAHVGVIQVLEENHIPICAIGGSSMGAYVGALWAAGLTPAQLEERAAEIRDQKVLWRLLDFIVPPVSGLIRGNRIREHLERDLGTQTFADLEKPLMVVATDLDYLGPHVFESGSISQAVHASASIPAICAPVTIDGRRYTDGGASEPLPVSMLRHRYGLDHVIAVNVMPPGDHFDTRTDPLTAVGTNTQGGALKRLFSRMSTTVNLLAYGNVLDTFRRALMSAQLRLISKEGLLADVLIQPDFKVSTWYDFENFQRYIQAGREAATAALPQIEALLHRNPKPDTDDENSPYPTRLEQCAA